MTRCALDMMKFGCKKLFIEGLLQAFFTPYIREEKERIFSEKN
jgi:hypothetical protein